MCVATAYDEEHPHVWLVNVQYGPEQLMLAPRYLCVSSSLFLDPLATRIGRTITYLSHLLLYISLLRLSWDSGIVGWLVPYCQGLASRWLCT